MTIVGIDWSTLRDDICIIDDTGRIIKEFQIPVSAPGFARLLEEIGSVETDRSKVLIAIEATQNPVVDFLNAAGFVIYALNPLAVNRFKDRYSASAKKDDRFDAMNIARIIQSERHLFSPLKPSSSKCQSLRIHCLSLDDTIRERTRMTNQLHAHLMRYFPAFCEFFSELKSNVALKVVCEISQPSRFVSLSKSEFVKTLSAISHFGTKRRESLYELLQRDVFILDVVVEEALGFRSIQLAKRILNLNAEIKELERVIDSIFNAHPLSQIFKSVPGSGGRLAPALLVCFGDNFERFESSQQVQCYSGTAPVTAKSGKSFEVHKMRRACNKYFRNSLHTLSFTSLRFAPWAKEHYYVQRTSGKPHSAALRSVSNKWAKILFAMWKTRSTYDPGNFQEKRKLRQAA